jgi:hypothetical protein
VDQKRIGVSLNKRVKIELAKTRAQASSKIEKFLSVYVDAFKSGLRAGSLSAIYVAA